MKIAPQRFVKQLTLAAVFAFGAWPSAHAADAAGHIQTVVGSAKVYDAAGKERDIKRGDEIRPGDRIVTGDQSLVQVKFTDGAYVSVRTNTDVALEHYRHDEKAPKESGALLKLARGALRSITGAIGAINPDGYRVITPTATIGIRGTDHEPVFIPQPKAGETPIGTPGTYDKVNSGATVLRTTAGELNIRPGQTGFVPAVVTTAPTVLPRTPDFFKNLDPSKDKSASNRGEQGRANAAEASDGRSLQRGESSKDGAKDSDKRDTASRGEQGRATAAEASDGRSLRGEAAKQGASTSSGDSDKTSRTGDSPRNVPMLSPLSSGRSGSDAGMRTLTPSSGGEIRSGLSPSSTTLTAPTSGDRSVLPKTTTLPTAQPLSPTTSPIRTISSPTTTLSPITTPTTTTTTIKR